MYTTECATIEMDKPRQTRRMSAQEIVEYMRSHFKTEFTFDEYGRMTGERALNKSTAYMKACFTALADPDDWKAPFRANFPGCGDEWAEAVVIWYHGRKAHRHFIGVTSLGYAC